MALTYNPNTGEWVSTSVPSSGGSSSGSSSSKPSSGSSSSGSSSSSSSSQKQSGGNLTYSTPDSSSSTGIVEKTYNDIQINTLEGSLSFIVTKETIKLKAGDTVKLNGLGKHLSGSYYVKEVLRTVGSNGYSHKATVIRTDFGESLKVDTKNPTQVDKTPVSSPDSSNNAQKIYIVRRGDCLWNLAKRFYGKGDLWTKIYEANTQKIMPPLYLIFVGQRLIIP